MEKKRDPVTIVGERSASGLVLISLVPDLQTSNLLALFKALNLLAVEETFLP